MKININNFSKKGEKIYKNLIKKDFELKHKGEIITIELDNKDYFIGKTPVEALKKAKVKYPEKVFYTKRIGYDSVYEVRRVS